MSNKRIPREYQNWAMEAIFESCKEKDVNPVIALPVGTGKESVQSFFIQKVLFKAPRTRFLCVVASQELVEQNEKGLLDVWSTAPTGVYCSGLNRKEIAQVTFASIGSIAKKYELLGKVDIVMIDECQNVSVVATTMYTHLINSLKAVNPKLRVIGLSGTPFRLGHGLLYENHPVFNKLALTMCDFDGYKYFFDNYYLCPLISKRTVTLLDYGNVKKASNGDYDQHQLQEALDKESVTRSALEEIVMYGADRKCWLIFASGVEHSDHIAEMLNTEFGIPTVSIHSKLDDTTRKQYIADYKAGKYRCAVNNLVLTVGFNHPAIDLLADIAPTTSPVRFVQKLGRSSRMLFKGNHDISTLEGRKAAQIEGGKMNALVLDFARNVDFHGSLNMVEPPKPKGKGGDGKQPVKTCIAFECGCSSLNKSKCDVHSTSVICNTIHHPSARFCDCCGAEFVFEVKITHTASNKDIIAKEKVTKTDLKTPKPKLPDPESEWYPVQHIEYKRQKTKSGDMLKVSYNPSTLDAVEWIGFEHPDGSWQRSASFSWWNKRISGKCPRSIDEVLKYVDQLPKPARILVSQKGKYLNVKKVEFADDFVMSRLVEVESVSIADLDSDSIPF